MKPFSHPRLRALAIAIAAVGVQLPLFWSFAATTESSGPLSPCQGDRCRPPRAKIQAVARPAPTPPPLPENVQVVETPDQPDLERPEPVETRRVSDKTTRTEKETKAPVAKRTDRRKPQPPSPTEPSPVQSEASKSPSPTVTSPEETKVELAAMDKALPEADKGARRPETVLDDGKKTKVLLPPGSNAAALANLQALAGDFSSTDHLPDVDDGKSTVLNADRHRFADFFLKVKSQVERHWKPSGVYVQRDPTGQLYGVKDRYTVLRVQLSPSGQLLGLTTTRASGLDFMDDEAKRAFREAAPFLNPPRGLIGDEGDIRFEFGFYFEISAGRLRTNWKRL